MALNFRVLLELIAVVMVWRGVWMVLDMFLFPDHPLISALISAVVGLIFLLADDLLLEEIKS